MTRAFLRTHLIPSVLSRPFSVVPLHHLPRRTTAVATAITTRSVPSVHSVRRMAASYTPTTVLRTPSVRIACVQIASGPDKSANLALAAAQVATAAHDVGPRGIVVLPECFNSPYGTQFFGEYAEVLRPSPPPAETAPSFHALATMARTNNVYLIGGSVPERSPDNDDYYNTCLVFGPDGTLLATHRKVHLFDIDIPGKLRFRESDVLSAGDRVTLVDLPDYGIVGVAICYDVRFPELATIAARRGAFALVYPGAFNLTTGPLHWELLARARAVDNQIYVAMCSPARDMVATYNAWGHSMIVGPMADVLIEAQEKPQIVTAALVAAHIEEARNNIPLCTQRRFDVYPDVCGDKV